MKSYTALYRPTSFDSVIGQASAVGILRTKASKSPPGTYLLSGPRGTGKTTLARVFARTINCRDPNTCSTQSPCVSCECFYSGHSHPDIIEMNGAEARGIEDARTLVERSKLNPRFNYRVFILDEMHQLTPQAQECLLKPFEETGLRTVWILCTTNPEKLKPTIISRAVRCALTPLSDADMSTLLSQVCASESIILSDDIRAAIINTAMGGPRDALKALESYVAAVEAGVTDVPTAIRQLEHSSPAVVAVSYIGGVWRKQADRAFAARTMTDSPIRLLEDSIEMLRCMVYKATGASELYAAHRFHSKIDKVQLAATDVPRLAALLTDHVSTLATLKTYTLSEADVLDALTARSLV